MKKSAVLLFILLFAAVSLFGCASEAPSASREPDGSIETEKTEEPSAPEVRPESDAQEEAVPGQSGQEEPKQEDSQAKEPEAPAPEEPVPEENSTEEPVPEENSAEEPVPQEIQPDGPDAPQPEENVPAKPEPETEKPKPEPPAELQAEDPTLLKKARTSYETLDLTARLSDRFGGDMVAAWDAAVNNEEQLVTGGAAWLAEALKLSEDELRNGAAHMAYSSVGSDWNSISDEAWEELRKQADQVLDKARENSSLPETCVSMVWSAYLETGLMDILDGALPDAEGTISSLEQKGSKYAAPLKAFYQTIHTYAQWCEEPTGSLPEASELLAAFRDSCAAYRSQLGSALGK